MNEILKDLKSLHPLLFHLKKRIKSFNSFAVLGNRLKKRHKVSPKEITLS